MGWAQLGAYPQDPMELSNVTSGCALLRERVEATCWLERSVRNRLEETGSLEQPRLAMDHPRFRCS